MVVRSQSQTTITTVDSSLKLFLRRLQLNGNISSTNYVSGRRLKRTRSKDANDAENADSVQIFPAAGFILVAQSMVIQKIIFALNLSSHGTSLLLRPVAMKSIKRPTRDVFQAFATHACLVHDVTDTEFRAQYDSTRRRCLATFKRECLNSSANVLCVF